MPEAGDDEAERNAPESSKVSKISRAALQVASGGQPGLLVSQCSLPLEHVPYDALRACPGKYEMVRNKRALRHGT